MKTAIYVRVSTKKQDYEAQKNACLNYCKIKGWTDVDIFKEKESSVKARPVFDEVLRLSKAGHYGVIVLFRLDRGWRRSNKFVMDYASLNSRGIKVVSVMECLDPTTPMGEAMMTIIMALNQLERDNISLATKQRLDAIKLEKKLGRKVGSKDTVKRDKTNYKARWAQLRGDKQLSTTTPEHVNLKSVG